VRVHQLPFREDSSNNDLSLVRNRIRHRLLPQLREAVNPGLDQALDHLAEIAGDEMAYWDALAAAFPARVWGDGLVVSASAFASLPRAVSRHVVRSLVRRVKGSLRGWEFDHTEAMRALAARPHGDGRWHGAGVEFFRSFDEILVRPWPVPPDSARMFQIGAGVPGRYRIPGGPEVLLNRIEVPDSGAKPPESADWLSIEVLDRSLVLRTWTPGDTISLPGTGPKRLKVLFQDARVPIWERRSWPVLESDGQVLWTQRFGVADRLAIDVLGKNVEDRQEAMVLEVRVVAAAGSSPLGKKKR
jgi:tRNA(Ile)-lysidine synthase